MKTKLLHSILFLLLVITPAFSVDSQQGTRHEPIVEKDEDMGYTINFNNVSVIEVIKFLSKVADYNFIFNEQELGFNVTIISEEATDISNVMSALVQVLRVNGMEVLEQEGNLLIHKNPQVKELATVVSEKQPFDGDRVPALVTRFFRIKNGNPSAIASIIRPMISKNALLEVSEETRQLIITDVVTNVDKIASLLNTLDAPQTTLEVDSYRAKHSEVGSLVDLVNQIITPLAEGNPVILVPQGSTDTIYIVSTPFLIDKTLAILEDLDAPRMTASDRERLTGTQHRVLLYRATHISPYQVVKSLKEITSNLSDKGLSSEALTRVIEQAKIMEGQNLVLFTGNPNLLNEVRSLLTTIDTEEMGRSSGPTDTGEFFVYTPKYRSSTELMHLVHETADDLEGAHLTNASLLKTLRSVKLIEETGALLFTGSTANIDKVKQLLTDIDSQTSGQGKLSMYEYKLQHVPLGHLREKLMQLKATADYELRDAIDSLEYDRDSNTVTFHGTESAINRIQEFIPYIDTEKEAKSALSQRRGFVLYTLKSTSGEAVLEELHKVADTLKNSRSAPPDLIQALEDVKWVKSSNALLITGSQSSVDHIQKMVEEFDTPGKLLAHDNFLMYKPRFISLKTLKTNLEEIVKDLEGSGLSDPSLLHSLQNFRIVEASKSVIFTGTENTLEKVKSLLDAVDAPSDQAIKHVGKSTFLIYKIKFATGPQLISALKTVARDIAATGTPDKDFAKTMENMRYVKETNSIVFTGTEKALKRALTLAQKFDTSEHGFPDVARVKPEGYVIYEPHNLEGEALIGVVKDFERNLVNSGIKDAELNDVINNLQWMSRTSSILVTGKQDAVEKVVKLLERFDTPGDQEEYAGKTAIETLEDISFLIYKLQYHQGSDIEFALTKIGNDIAMKEEKKSGQDMREAIASLQWVNATNSLVATGTKASLAKLHDLIKSLDTPLKQIFIEVLVLETDVNNALNYGLRWGSQGQYKSRFGYGGGNYPPLAATADPLSAFNTNLQGINGTTRTPTGSDIPLPTTKGFDLGIIGDIILHKGNTYLAIGALVNALQTDTDSTIVLNQKLITQDNRNSTLFVGSNLPFTGSTVTSQDTSLTNSANIEYRDIGVSLSITPTVGDGNIVTMDIDQDITETIGTTPANSSSQVNGIATSKTTTQTRVSVPDNHFLVLTGMMRNTSVNSKSGLPCLGGLPFVGAAFSETKNTDEKRNVIVFVKPHIIHSFNEYKEITATQECSFRSQSNAEEFDQGLELVKTVDDE